MQEKKERIYTGQFWRLCFSAFIFFASFNMIIPELPAHLTNLGGEDYKGLIISLFTVTAGLSRPFSGKLTDTIGRIPVMIIGALVCFVCSMLYPVAGTVFSFLLLRFFHGFSTGFKPTGTTAYVADVVPVTKRGEAMGILGLSSNLGMAAGPAFGSWIALEVSLDFMFYLSSALGIFSVIILAGMKETVKNTQRFQFSMLKIKLNEIIEPRVLVPSIVMLLTAYSFGLILTIIPDYSVFLGLENKGIFFTIFTVSSLAVRLLAGRASDRFGREQVLKVSTITLAIAMLCIGFSGSRMELFVSAILFGLAVGMNSPTIFAWTVDLSRDEHRGRAMSTMFIFLELGIGSGAIFSGWIYSNNPEMFKWAFWSGAVLSIVAFCFLILRSRKKLIERV